MEDRGRLIEGSTEVLDLERQSDSPAFQTRGTMNYVMEGDDAEDVHLRDYWRNIRKHIWLVIGIVTLTTSLVAVYMARQPDIFEADARVQVGLENGGSVLASGGSNSVVLNNATTDPTYFNTQLQILTSPGLLRRVVKSLDLENNAALQSPKEKPSGSVLQRVARMVGLGGKEEPASPNPVTTEVPLTSTVPTASSRDDLVEAKRLEPFVRSLKSNLVIEPVKETRGGYVKETRLIDVSFLNTDPQFAAKVVNAVVDTYVLFNLEKKTATNTSTGDFLQKRIAELQSQIRTGEESLINYAKNNQILSLSEDQNTVVVRLNGLGRQLLEAENARQLTEAALRAAQAPGAASALSENDAKRATEAASKLDELRAKRAELLVENTEEWPEVKVVDRQIVELEKQVDEIRARAVGIVLTNLETRYRQNLATEQALRKTFNEQKANTLQQNEAAINYRIIEQEIETNKTLLKDLLQRSKENEVVLNGTPNNIFVVDYGITPDSAVGPARARRVIVAFILSLAFGLSLALFLEYLNDTLRSAEDVEKALHLPILAIIPSLATIKRRLLAPAAALTRRTAENSPELLVNAETRSPLAEAYRQLRTSILLSTPGRAPKTLLVTSSLPSEGKTTTAINTALSLAQTGASVLLIDADMRRPRLHSIFGISNRSGLSTYLSSEMSESELMQMIHPHEPTGLHMLPSGPVPPNPAELIGSVQMRRLLMMIESNFTHIVIDSPPSASFTDGVLIASLVDGVVLVVHGGKTARSIVRRTRQILQDTGARIFGVVLNNVNVSAHDYYYYQSYYHRDYYDNGEPAAGSAD